MGRVDVPPPSLHRDVRIPPAVVTSMATPPHAQLSLTVPQKRARVCGSKSR
jgi:hypothetical protein